MFKIYAFIIFAKKEFNFKGNSPFPYNPMLLIFLREGVIGRKPTGASLDATLLIGLNNRRFLLCYIYNGANQKKKMVKYL